MELIAPLCSLQKRAARGGKGLHGEGKWEEQQEWRWIRRRRGVVVLQRRKSGQRRVAWVVWDLRVEFWVKKGPRELF